MSDRPRIALVSTDTSCITAVQEALFDQNLSIHRDPYTFLESYAPHYEVLILDLETSSSILRVAEIIRERDGAVHIILLAHSPRYALLGYSIDADAYLLTPFSADTFRTTWNQLSTDFARPEDALLIPIPGAPVRILLSHILFIESVRHTITVHTLERAISTTLPLSHFEEQLTAYPSFFRCHASSIVNLTAVAEITDTDCVLATGERIRIARNRRKEFLTRLSSTLTAS